MKQEILICHKVFKNYLLTLDSQGKNFRLWLLYINVDNIRFLKMTNNIFGIILVSIETKFKHLQIFRFLQNVEKFLFRCTSNNNLLRLNL